MDQHLKAFMIMSGGPAGLKGFQLMHHTDNGAVWCEVVDAVQDAQPGSETFHVKDQYEIQCPWPVPLSDLSIGYGTRTLKDPLIQAMLRHCIDVSLFLQNDVTPNQDPSSTQQGGSTQPQTRTTTPAERENPINPQFWERLKGLQEAPSEDMLSFDLMKEAIYQIANKGSLTDYTETVMQDYPDQQKSWRSKARFLLDVYKEPDSRIAKLMAATYFLASRINFVSVDCEYMATQYCAEIKAAIRNFGKSETWSKDTLLEIESMIREKYFSFKALAEKEVARGNARPMNNPGNNFRANLGNRSHVQRPYNRQHDDRAHEGGQPEDHLTGHGKRQRSMHTADNMEEHDWDKIDVDEYLTACDEHPQLDLEGGINPIAARNETLSNTLGSNGFPEDVLTSKDGEVDLIHTGHDDDIDCHQDPLLDSEHGSKSSSSRSLQNLCTHALVAAIPQKEPSNRDPEELRAEMRNLLAELDQFARGEVQINEEQDIEWLRNVDQKVLNPDEFRAGNFNQSLPAWQELLKNSSRKSSKVALGALKTGLKPSFEGTQNAKEQKRKVVVAMLRGTVPKREVNFYLQGRFPKEVEFSNHKSADDNASDGGYGGFVELPGFEKFQIVGTFSPEEAEMSSTAREMIGLLRTLQSALEKGGPDCLSGSTVMVTTDNLGATYAINSMRSSSPEVNDLLKRFFAFSCDNAVDIRALWKPRDQMEAEDYLSRKPDSSDWGINTSVLQTIKATFGVEPLVDLFASGAWRVAGKFVTKDYTPGCIGVDALHLDWQALLPEGEFAWIFPPVRLLNETVRMIERNKTCSILVVPERRASNWWQAISKWELERPIQSFDIPRSEASCSPSLRVPQGTVNPAFFLLKALLIKWKK